jgi:hypothetical protein
MLEIRRSVVNIINNLIKHGPKWKEGQDSLHFEKRRVRGHIPLDWHLKDYNNLIIGLAKESGNETYLYSKQTFEQRYFVIGDGSWIFIIGENEVMETAFPPNHYQRYLSEEGYQFLGTIKEVRAYAI